MYITRPRDITSTIAISIGPRLVYSEIYVYESANIQLLYRTYDSFFFVCFIVLTVS